VEDGIPFCRQCNAPQIRVAIQEAIEPAEMVDEASAPHYSATSPSAILHWPHVLRSAALAGLLGVILVMVLKQAFALAMIGAGFLSVYFYRRKNPFSNLTAARGALLGALSGMFGSILVAIPCTFAIFSFRAGGEKRAAIVDALQQQVARSADPHARDVLEYLKTPEGFSLMMVGLMVVVLILFLILASFGGAIAAAMYRRKQRL
jgi:hypothetical protein